MLAIADHIKPIRDNTTVHQASSSDASDPSGWQILKLENPVISKIAQDAERAGLGNLQEVYTCIIPPFHLKEKLPTALSIVEFAWRYARPHESVGHWKGAGNIYKWLFQV